MAIKFSISNNIRVRGVELALLSLLRMVLNPKRLFVNERVSGVGKSYKNILSLGLLEIITILCHTYHYFFFLSFITSVFYNIRHISYWMAMTNSVLTPPLNFLCLIIFSLHKSSFHIGGYGYFHTYVVLYHFLHNGSLWFSTHEYIRVSLFLSHIFSFAFVLDSISSKFLTHCLV